MQSGIDDSQVDPAPPEPQSIWHDPPGTQPRPPDEPVTLAEALAYLRHPSPRTLLVLLFLIGNLFLILDKDKLAGWTRVIAIWTMAFGASLLAAALAYRLAQSGRARSYPIVKKVLYAI